MNNSARQNVLGVSYRSDRYQRAALELDARRRKILRRLANYSRPESAASVQAVLDHLRWAVYWRFKLITAQRACVECAERTLERMART